MARVPVSFVHGLVLVAAGCGFEIRGGPTDAPPTSSDSTTDGPPSTDGPLPDSPPSDGPGPDAPPMEPSPTACVTRWLSGNVSFTTPSEIDLGNSSHDGDPYVSPDQLTMYFVSNGLPNFDIWMARRPNVGVDWEVDVVNTSISSSQFDESKAVLTSDGRTVVYASIRPGVGMDFFEATRPNTNTAFGASTTAPFANINTTEYEYDPHIDPSGLRLYYSGVIGGLQVLRVAERATVSGVFGMPANLANVTGGMSSANQAVGAADPTLSGDERVIIYTTSRDADNANLWYATRASRFSAFGTPVMVPTLNTGNPEGGAYLSEDGCTVYFESRRPGNAGSPRIFVSQLSM